MIRLLEETEDDKKVEAENNFPYSNLTRLVTGFGIKPFDMALLQQNREQQTNCRLLMDFSIFKCHNAMKLIVVYSW